jgi:hypothetical protein
MNNKKLLIIIGAVLLALILLTKFYILLILLRLWPLWLFLLVIAAVIYVIRKNNLPDTNGEYRGLKPGFEGFLQKLAVLLNSGSFNDFVRKLFLYPLLAIVLIFVLVVSLEFIFSDYLKTRSTRKEAIQMCDALNNYKYHARKYPEDLQKLIGNNPLKKDWASDSWERPYHYEVTKDLQNFYLCTLGKDGKAGNEDDVCFDKHGEINHK